MQEKTLSSADKETLIQYLKNPESFHVTERDELVLKLSRVTDLNLDRCKIGGEGARILTELLKVNTSITFIDLSNNNIGDEGAMIFAEALKNNTSITSVYLRLNSIGDDGATIFADALKNNTSITFVDLAMNSIGDKGVNAITEALKNNVNIIKFKHRVSKSDEPEIQAIVKHNREMAKKIADKLDPENPLPDNADFYNQLLQRQSAVKAVLVKRGMSVENAEVLINKAKEYPSENFLKVMGISKGDKGVFATLPVGLLKIIGNYIDVVGSHKTSTAVEIGYGSPLNAKIVYEIPAALPTQNMGSSWYENIGRSLYDNYCAIL